MPGGEGVAEQYSFTYILKSKKIRGNMGRISVWLKFSLKRDNITILKLHPVEIKRSSQGNLTYLDKKRYQKYAGKVKKYWRGGKRSITAIKFSNIHCIAHIYKA